MAAPSKRPATQPKDAKPDEARPFPLHGLDPNAFDRLLTQVAAWVSKGEIKTRFKLPAKFGFDFDEATVEAFLKQEGLPRQAALQQMELYIPLMVSGILAGNRNVVITFLLEQMPDDTTKAHPQHSKDDVRAELNRRLQSVEDRIATPDIRRQFAAKHSSKLPVLIESEWDVLEKRDQKGKRPPPKIVSAVYRLVYQEPQPRREGSFGVIQSFLDVFDNADLQFLTLTLTLQDVQELIIDLKNVEQAIKNAAQPEGS